MRLLAPYKLERGQLIRSGSIPRIDWSHPLTRGLVSYGYDAGFGPIDLVTRGRSTIINSARVTGTRSSKFGNGLLYNSGGASSGTCATALPNTSDFQSLTTAAPYTVACGCVLTVTPGATAQTFLYGSGVVAQSPFTLGSAHTATTDFSFGFGDNARAATASGLATNNVFHTLTGVALTANTTACYVDGVLAISPVPTTTLTANAGTRPVFNGQSTSSNSNKYFDGFVYYGAAWKKRALTAAEARQLHADPYCFLIYPEDEMWARRVPVTVSTGTLAATEATDVAAFVGSVGVSGLLAATETPDIAALAGSVGVSGTLATIEAPDVAAFAGSVVVSGALVATETVDITAFAGGVLVSGALAVTEALDVAAFAGSTGVSGTLAVTGAPDVAAFVGSVGVSGSLAVTETPDVLAANNFPFITGTFASNEVRDIASFAGGVGIAISGTLAANEVGVSLSNNSFPENSAVNTLVGALAVVGIDTAAFSGSVTGVVISGTLAVTEAQDQALFSNYADITGTLAANESSILLSNNTFLENAATNTVIGSLTVLGVDAAAFSGSVGVSGTLDVGETVDAAAFNGTVFDHVTGQLAATEAIDSAAFAGEIFNIPAGQLVVTETPDAAAFAGAVTGIAGQLAVTEARDLAAFNGSITEVLTAGDLIVIEPKDTALFIGITTLPDDSDFENWKFGHRFDRSLTSRFPWQNSFGSRP